MNTHTHRHILTPIMAGLFSLILLGGWTQAQSAVSSGIEARKAKPGLKTAQLHHVSLTPSTAAPGQTVTMKARLEWSDIGQGWKAVPGKPVSFLVDYTTINQPSLEVKTTDGEGWVSFTYTIPNNLPTSTRRAWIHLEFQPDGTFKGDGVKEYILIKR